MRVKLLALMCCILGMAGCVESTQQSTLATSAIEPLTVFTLRTADDGAMVRAITKAASCPSIRFDKNAPLLMAVRVQPAVIADRHDNKQPQTKDAVLDVLVCETPWPQGAKTAVVANKPVAAPKSVKRIVIVSDTGCRMKASDNGFQDCNNPSHWPFAQVATSAAALKPDLVIHLGDVNYRESPCPEGNTGCANSPWGYGFDTWQADLFAPAKPLLDVAPWLFVRGNHESCWRSGQGWFRFLDIAPWQEKRSCNLAAQDALGDFSDPFTVQLTAGAQLIVFDSSRVPSQALTPKDAAFEKYAAEMQQVNQLAQRQPVNFFLSHHPALGFGLPEKGDKGALVKPGNGALQSVLKTFEPKRLFPEAITLTLHGHVHLFESIGFATPHPATLVMGNSGSLNEGSLPNSIPAGTEPYAGAVVEDFATMADFGFASLDLIDAADPGHWLLTEYKADGTPVYRCDIKGTKNHCVKL